MKLLRVGELGSEIVAALDSNNVIRDLSDHIKDLNPQTINEETLNKLKTSLRRRQSSIAGAMDFELICQRSEFGLLFRILILLLRIS